MDSQQPRVLTDRKASISRRSFIKSIAAAGSGIAMVSAGLKLAKADPYGPFSAAGLSNEQLIDMYKKMLQIRWYDRTLADKILTERGFRGYGHCYCGEEAVAVGVCAALNKDDWIYGHHRGHGHSIAKGADIKKMAAEITFKASGTNKGYGGTMHIMQKDVGMLGEDGVVGPGGILGAGAAVALKARGKGQVAVTFGGDAHAYSPFLFIALHEARKFKLPFIYVLERNGYQIAVPWSSQTYLKQAADVARGLDLPGVVVDGQAVLNVYNVTKEAVDRARAGEGPTLIEAMTYRYYDHVNAAGAKAGQLGAFGLGYRPDKEVQYWLTRDPIEIHKQTLINWKVFTPEKADELEATVKQEILDAYKWAAEQAVPKAEDALKHVYVEETVLPRQLADCPPY